MSAKHTPGPWKIHKTHDSDRHSYDVSIYGETQIHKNPRAIARIYGEGVLSNLVEERDANARLIAAAPELLETLEAMTSGMISESRYSLADDTRAWMLHQSQRARRAIAAAKGEA